MKNHDLIFFFFLMEQSFGNDDDCPQKSQLVCHFLLPEKVCQIYSWKVCLFLWHPGCTDNYSVSCRCSECSFIYMDWDPNCPVCDWKALPLILGWGGDHWFSYSTASSLHCMYIIPKSILILWRGLVGKSHCASHSFSDLSQHVGNEHSAFPALHY